MKKKQAVALLMVTSCTLISLIELFQPYSREIFEGSKGFYDCYGNSDIKVKHVFSL